MRSFVALLAPALAAATPIGIVTGGDKPSPDQITIISASASGNGCPQGTVTTDLAADRQVRAFPLLTTTELMTNQASKSGHHFRFRRLPGVHRTRHGPR